MSYATMNRSTWIADGLRWIGSVCESAADAIDRDAAYPQPLEPVPTRPAFEEYLYDVRFRIHNRI
ncbi:hypothetical protein [Usitatibacter palustris]|uniref:Uncharacterized protein n=1 Tax=Usitatibacter palustris TaxID=2732487 RepID=A0A6M4H7U4_9PROT|nr:hypothetical protein [Usitatibacter palustris]QJR14067.1 hypothetical protein DSM104440_00860 [Usitatibacter palustris]